MRRWMTVLLCSLLALAGCAQEKPCVAENGVVCYDEETGQFQIEDNAVIRVMVDHEEYGEALVELWNQVHPEYPDVIEPVLASTYDAVSWMQSKTDLALMWSSDAAQILGYFQPVNEDLADQLRPYFPQQFGELLNSEALYYVPMSYYGMVFSTNVTMLQELGYAVADNNQDGLVDDFDSFEKLAELAKAWDGTVQRVKDQTVTAILPVSFSDLWSSVVWLSAGGFRFFSSWDALKPGFDSPEFLQALQFLRFLGGYSWYLEEAEVVPDESAVAAEAVEQPVSDPQPAATEAVMEEQNRSFSELNRQALKEGWQYDVYLEKLISPFSMVGTWMFYQEQEEIEQQDFWFSKMPSWQGQTLSPLAQSRGYLISAQTEYPSAANEVLRLIRSEAGIQLYLDCTDEIAAVTETDWADRRPVLAEGEEKAEFEEVAKLYLNFGSENRKQLMDAFAYSQEESMVAFQQDPSVRGWTMLEELGILDMMRKVFSMEMTPEEAQADLMARSETWMTPYQPQDEETENQTPAEK